MREIERGTREREREESGKVRENGRGRLAVRGMQVENEVRGLMSQRSGTSG